MDPGSGMEKIRIRDEKKVGSGILDKQYRSATHNVPYVPVVYMARDVMISMRETSITRGIGRGGVP